MATFHVYFMPEGSSTINDMKCIDAWSSVGKLDGQVHFVESKLQEYADKHGPGRVQLYEIKEEYGFYLPSLNLPTLREMIKDGRSINEEDYATDRQVNAINAVFDQLAARWPNEFGYQSDYSEYCMMATDDEQMDEALQILGDRADMKALPSALVVGALGRTEMPHWHDGQTNLTTT